MKNILSSVLDLFPNFNENKDIDFRSNGVLTLGVEIEMQIIDPETLGLSSNAENILKITAADKKITKEFFLSTLEINSKKCEDVFEVEKDLSASIDLLSKAGDKLGVKFSSTGCHPFSRYSDCLITPTARYNDLIDRNQWIVRRMTVYGLHVHIGMKSGDDAIRFNNFLLNFIPHLIALSASSPFWQGDDTGLAACRPTTYEALPTAGHPYRSKNWKEFVELYQTLKKCKAVSSLKDLWWDIRPSPHFGTIEIRVCDGLATLEETMAIVAFIHLLAHWFNDHGTWINQVPTSPLWFVRENKWRAIRHGLNADLIIDNDGKTRAIDQDILLWLEKLAPYEKKLGYSKYIKDLRYIVENGNSSTRQRKIYAKNNSFKEVVKFNIDEFIARKPIAI